METFIYIAKDRDANRIRGVVQAESRDSAIRNLQAEGLYLIALNPASSKSKQDLSSMSRRFSHSKISLSDLAFLARQLSTLLSSGVTLMRGLEVASSQCGSKRLYHVLDKIMYDVRSGLSLTESINKYPSVFSSLWQGLIDTGESSGNLAEVLDRLAEYLELRQEFERKVVSALMYPAILLIASIGAMCIFTFFILPRFQVIFSQLGVKLPLLTRIIFNLTGLLTHHIGAIIVVFSAVAVGLRFFVKSPMGRRSVDRVQLGFPFIKNFFLVYFLERFSSTSFILFQSGVPIVHTLEVIQRSIGNSIFQKEFQSIGDNVKGGKPLSAELAKSKMFPPLVIEMVAIAEEVGNFPEMFGKISKHYQTLLQTKVERVSALFEPLMIAFMGAVVGMIVISLFLPLFQIAVAYH